MALPIAIAIAAVAITLAGAFPNGRTSRPAATCAATTATAAAISVTSSY